MSIASRTVRNRSRRLLAATVLVLGVGAAACTVGPTGPPPPPAATAGIAVAYAEAQIGKPYCYAGAGPSCFDCSGLTMRAWQAAGVNMPHFSGSQFAMFPKVPMNQLQPGDLVFPADPNQHVGLYVGGGLMVHATTPGDVVRLAPLSDVPMVQAARPT